MSDTLLIFIGILIGLFLPILDSIAYKLSTFISGNRHV